MYVVYQLMNSKQPLCNSNAEELSMSKFCSRCGTPISEGARFCPSCGAKLAEQTVNIEENSQTASRLTLEQTDSSAMIQNHQMPLDEYVEDVGIKAMFFKTEGRLNRKRYFLRGCILFFICMIVEGILVAIQNISLMAIGSIILYIPLLISGVMLAIRRSHDLNHSGRYVIYMFIPIVGMIISLVLLFKKGTDGPNPYGPDPLG